VEPAAASLGQLEVAPAVEWSMAQP
jgi:hypothetical protein